MAKKRAKKKSGKKLGVVFLVIIIVIIVAAGVILGYPAYQKVSAIGSKMEQYLDTVSVPEEITSDIEIVNTDEEDYSVSWQGSSNLLTTTTKGFNVVRPNYFKGDVKATITITVSINELGFIENIITDLLKLDAKEKEYKVTIIRNDATDEEKATYIYESLYVPSYTNTNVGLITENAVFSDCTVNWTSDNHEVIGDDGTVVSIGNASLTADVVCGDVKLTKDFAITVGSDLPSINEVNLSFDDLATSRQYSSNTYSNLDFTSVKIEQESSEPSEDGINDISYNVAVFRIKDDERATITTKQVANLKLISFKYKYYDQTSTYTKESLISLYSSLDGEEWTLLKSEAITLGDHLFEYLNTNSGEYYYKIEITTEYASEKRVCIDDLLIERYINADDVKNALTSNLLTKYSDSTILPKTTSFGGVVSYTSSNRDAFTNLGKVTKTDAKTDVVLTISIQGFTFPVSFELPVSINGTTDVMPVEIFFIDLGKYGTSDCGESIYIKLGDIDVLIDAGDRFDSSNQAIKEVLDANSNDKIIDYVIATHPDSDHIGGMPGIFEEYKINFLVQFYGDHTTGVYTKYVEAYQNEGCDVCTVVDSYNNVGHCEREITLGDDVTITFIDTKNYQGKEPNTRSVVFLLEAYGVKTLFTGDADNGSNANLEKDYMDQVGDIDILKAVHHGTKEGTTSEFLTAVDPEVVIITNGNYLGNKHGHPTPDAINRIYQYDANINIYATTGGGVDSCSVTSSGSYKCDGTNSNFDRNGTIMIVITNNGYEITSTINDELIEMSDTSFWQFNTLKQYEHQGN